MNKYMFLALTIALCGCTTVKPPQPNDDIRWETNSAASKALILERTKTIEK